MEHAAIDFETMEQPNRSNAGFGLRLVAIIIDGIVINVALSILFMLMGKSHIGMYTFDDGSLQYNASGSLDVVANWLYYSLMESSVKQATLGKMVMGIMVTNEKGDRINFGQATGRYFGKIVSAIILGIGFLMCLWTDKKQCLHDIIAKCLVVKGKV